MKHERATEAVRQRASLYALGLLTQHEALSFELHLEECLVCRAELEKIEHAVAKIGLAVDEVEPPEQLRERLRALSSPIAGESAAAAGSEPPPTILAVLTEAAGQNKFDQIYFAAEAAEVTEPAFEPEFSAPPAPWPETASASPESVFPPVFPDDAQPVWEQEAQEPESTAKPAAPPLFAQTVSVSSGRPLAAVFAWILTIAFALLSAFAFYSLRDSREENRRMQDRIDESETGLADLGQKLEQQQANIGELEKVLVLAGKPGVRIARLKGEPSTPNYAGLVLCDTNAGECTIVGSFAPPPPGKDYQLWLSTLQGRTSIGVIPVRAGGRVFTTLFSTTLSSPQPMKDAANIIVSVEAKGGSPTLVGSFAAVGRLD
ncbi:MAG: anti-sigma factor [Acidobacteriota bacterium]|nr:anti-sigma factor [Acidobacteriota bacterium]